MSTAPTGTGSGVPSSRRRRWVWTAPVAVVAVVAAGAVAFNVSTADAAPSLPNRTPEQLVTDVLSSSTKALSGTVTTSSNLGLPSLPGAGDDASLSWLSFLTGDHTVRVWADGPDKQRLAVTGQLSEATVIRNGADLWTYTSGSNEISHQVLPDHSGATSESSSTPTPADLTPDGAARQFLSAVSSSTDVSVASTQSVAGRPAYTLVLAPKDAGSTVQQVRIAVDGATSVPLSFQVFGSSSTPAVSIGFTSVDFATPAASNFQFTPPAGSTVTDNPFGVPGRDRDQSSVPSDATGAAAAKPTVIGQGWTSVVEIHGAGAALGSNALLDQLTTSIGSSGGRLLQTALINAIILPDGRVFAGAVPAAALEQVASSTTD